MPLSSITAMAGGWTDVALVPAEKALKRSRYRARRYPSAIWDRAELCVQTKRTLFFLSGEFIVHLHCCPSVVDSWYSPDWFFPSAARQQGALLSF